MSDQLPALYRAWAAHEAHGRSALYEEIANRVAGSADAIAFLAAMPETKWQPNLFFAAVQYVCGTLEDWPAFRRALAERGDEIRSVMLARTTQTNEPARCATLLPALARLPRPLALIEVGASAGLCLLPDRYGYDYDGHRIPGTPEFPCRPIGDVPLPGAVPDIVWRAGLDLNPLDVASADDRAWLEALIWPGEQGRRPRLRAALEIARADPPRVVRGDLRTDLPALAAEAPRDATLVVFHTAVLAYLYRDEQGREAFARTVRDLGAVWLANEPAGLIDPKLATQRPGDFVLAQDGRPLAWTDPHGTWINWL